MELEKEGIDALEIRFTDNKPVLDLYLTRPIGLLSLLDEQCRGFNVCVLVTIINQSYIFTFTRSILHFFYFFLHRERRERLFFDARRVLVVTPTIYHTREMHSPSASDTTLET